jgi:hypothetical protein
MCSHGMPAYHKGHLKSHGWQYKPLIGASDLDVLMHHLSTAQSISGSLWLQLFPSYMTFHLHMISHSWFWPLWEPHVKNNSNVLQADLVFPLEMSICQSYILLITLDLLDFFRWTLMADSLFRPLESHSVRKCCHHQIADPNLNFPIVVISRLINNLSNNSKCLLN